MVFVLRRAKMLHRTLTPARQASTQFTYPGGDGGKKNVYYAGCYMQSCCVYNIEYLCDSQWRLVAFSHVFNA